MFVIIVPKSTGTFSKTSAIDYNDDKFMIRTINYIYISGKTFHSFFETTFKCSIFIHAFLPLLYYQHNYSNACPYILSFLHL